MKIFITGGAGLVGTDVLRRIAGDKYEMVALYRKTKSLERRNVQWIQGDINDKNIELRKFLTQTSVLIHNAAEINTGKTPEEKNRIKVSNIDFTQKLFDWAVEAGVQKILFTSSLSLIDTAHSQIITEDCQTNPKSLYSLSKAENEEYLKKIALKFNVQYAIFRLSSPICSSLDRMPNTVIKLWIERSQRKETIQVYGSGSRTQDFVSTYDIANVFDYCIGKTTTSGTFNIASGTTLSMLDVAKIITAKFGNDFVHVGEDLKETERWNISIDKAKKELAYSPFYSAKDCMVKLLDSIGT